MSRKDAPERLLCPHCGKNPPNENRSLCSICTARNNKRGMTRYRRCRKTGICFRCGASPADPGKSYCFWCGVELRLHRLALPEEERVRARQALRDFDGKCQNPGCTRTDPGAKKEWHLDHCHSTNRFRGILCQHCNHLLGNARDSEEVLLGAIKYLNQFTK